jgi:hypothetical protein
MRMWKTWGLALALGLAMAVPTSALAYGDGTPDEQPPAEEPPCDRSLRRGIRTLHRVLRGERLRDPAGQDGV